MEEWLGLLIRVVIILAIACLIAWGIIAILELLPETMKDDPDNNFIFGMVIGIFAAAIGNMWSKKDERNRHVL